MKKYAIVIDTSPSEQIIENDDQVFCLGILFGLRSPESFNLVGNQFPDEEKRMNLRKYAGSSSQYKARLKEHLVNIKEADHVLATASIVNQRFIKRMGLAVWEKANGKLPNPFNINKKGKPRYRLGGYKMQDGTEVEPYTVLKDDLCIIGWLASELGLLHSAICKINEEIVKLDVLIDRLPNDQGPKGVNKAELLKGTIGKLTESTIHIAGIPDTPDYYQRDLLTDNIAGLCRGLMERDPIVGKSEIESLLRMTKFSLPKT